MKKIKRLCSSDFAVVCLDVEPETLTVSANNLYMMVGESQQLTATPDPMPYLEENAQIEWLSYNPDVATVDEEGNVVAVAPGYAYISVACGDVMSYCVVSVTAPPPPPTYVVSFDTMGGSAIAAQEAEEGESAARPANPSRSGYSFAGWYTSAAYNQEFDFSTPVYEDITLFAKWNPLIVVRPVQPDVPDVPDQPDQPDEPDRPKPPVEEKLPFTDVAESDWFCGDVKYVYENGLMNGVSDTLFGPYTQMSRAMVVTVLYRMDGSPAVSGSNSFTDLTADWYKDAVQWAVAEGIIKGSNVGLEPTGGANRAQAAAILHRFLDK